MTIKVELGPDLEARLLEEAKSQGIPMAKAAERLLAQALTQRSGATGTLTVAEFRAMLGALAEGSEDLPALPTETLTKKSLNWSSAPHDTRASHLDETGRCEKAGAE